MIEIGLKLMSVYGETDQYKINIRSLVSTGYTSPLKCLWIYQNRIFYVNLTNHKIQRDE